MDTKWLSVLSIIIVLADGNYGAIPLLSPSNAFMDVMLHKYGPFSSVNILDKTAVTDIFSDLFTKLECEETSINCSVVSYEFTTLEFSEFKKH